MDELLYEVRLYYYVVEQIKRNLWYADGGTASFPVNNGGTREVSTMSQKLALRK
jgi:hypothetical protein